MLPQEAGQFAVPAALGKTGRALVADRATGLKQFGSRFALVQVDGLGLMAAGLALRAPARRAGVLLRPCANAAKAIRQASITAETRIRLLRPRRKGYLLPRMSPNPRERKLCENGPKRTTRRR